MSLEVECSFSCRPNKGIGQTNLMLGALATAATTIVAWGGLSSLQNTLHGYDRTVISYALSGVYGFTPLASRNPDVGLDSITDPAEIKILAQDVFRYYWFHLSWNIIVVTALIVILALGKLPKFRGTLVGLFSVGTLLYIQASDAFLSANDNDVFLEDPRKDRMRTTVAGFIMTAALNAIMVLFLGWEF